MKSLSEFFPKCLEKACSEMRVVLILDSLDQLSPEDGGRQLDWWPRGLPENALVIMSTLPGEEFEAFPNLKVSSLLFIFMRWRVREVRVYRSCSCRRIEHS